MSPDLRRVLSLGLSSLVLGGLPACSKGANNSIPPQSFESAPTQVKALSEPSDANALAKLGEDPEQGAHLVWLKKDFWLNRKIWISLGVERASVTGLATSVMGYVPAELERNGQDLIVKRQNRGLYGGSTLGPDFAINSYPIVGERDDAILIDFSSPKDPYGLSTVGLFDGTSSHDELSPRLEYTKSVESSERSVSFTNVIVAKSPAPLFDPESNSAEAMAGLDPYTLSATIRTDWVTELESPNFNPLKIDGLFGFFTGSPLVTDSGLSAETFVSKIDTSKKMLWSMSANTPAAYQDAVKSGLLAWNEALGKDVISVELGSPDNLSVTDPKTSNVIWDDNQAIGMAFANWRSHPYTGEIVQAQVYMSGSMWVTQAKMIYKMRQIEKQLRALGTRPQFDDMNAATPAPIAEASASSLKEARRQLKAMINIQAMKAKKKDLQRRFVLGWNRSLSKHFAEQNEFCLKQSETQEELNKKMAALEKLSDSLADLEANGENSEVPSTGNAPAATFVGPVAPQAVYSVAHSPYPNETSSSDQFAIDVVRSVVMHEAGHTMGLRHNFIGSMETSEQPSVSSASIMDYNDLVIDAQFNHPGTNDMVVMKAVYGSKEDKEKLKNIRFCTDEHASAQFPGCTRGDFAQNNVDGIRVTEESYLMFATRLLQKGAIEAGIGMINQAVSSVAPAIHYINFPTDKGVQFLRDRSFAEKQAQAFALYTESKNMLGQNYPAEIKSVYGQILAQLLAASVNSRLGESDLFTQVVVELKNNALDEGSTLELSTRLASLKGLQNIQDLKARGVIVEIADRLKEKAAQNPSSDIAQRMEDEEVLTAMQRMLENGYFKLEK